MEKVMEAYTLPYVKQTVNGNFLYASENSNQGSGNNLQGWERMRGGREVQEGGSRESGHMYIYC